MKLKALIHFFNPLMVPVYTENNWKNDMYYAYVWGNKIRTGDCTTGYEDYPNYTDRQNNIPAVLSILNNRISWFMLFNNVLLSIINGNQFLNNKSPLTKILKRGKSYNLTNLFSSN